MPKYKIIATIEATTEADNRKEAEEVCFDCLDWSEGLRSELIDAHLVTLEEIDDDT